MESWCILIIEVNILDCWTILGGESPLVHPMKECVNTCFTTHITTAIFCLDSSVLPKDISLFVFANNISVSVVVIAYYNLITYIEKNIAKQNSH